MGSVLVAVPAHFEVSAPAGERRRSRRRELRLGVGTAGEAVTILNISMTGMLIESSSPMLVGSRFTVALAYVGSIGAEVVWNRGEFYGCEFDRRISPALLSAALLQGSPGVL